MGQGWGPHLRKAVGGTQQGPASQWERQTDRQREGRNQDTGLELETERP